MGILNRDLAPSQQRDLFTINTGAMATGGTYTVCLVPYPCQLATVAMNFFGVSNTPSLNLDITRYNSAGVTTITGAITTLAQAGATLAVGATVSSGSSLVTMQAGDIITARISGTNANITGGILTLVLQALQDVKTEFGV